MPLQANAVIRSMTAKHLPSKHCFFDGRGHYVDMADNPDGDMYAHEGYYKAMWMALNGDVRIGEDGKQLYARIFNIEGPTENWKPFDDVNIEFDVPRHSQKKGWTDAVRYVCQQNNLVVRHGIRIGDRAWWTTSDADRDHVEAHNVGDKYAFEMYVDPQGVTASEVEQARKWMEWLTADPHSYENLQAMWATPFLEPYKHLGYILYGKGGNGKGILLEQGLMRQYPDKAHVVKASALASSSKFESGQEVTRLDGAWWSIDPEASEITEPMFETLKSVCTGSTLVGRNIGQNTMTVINKSTLIIATNMPVSVPRTNAFDRRLAIIRMKDGRKPDDFRHIIQFIRIHGITPFLIASCQFWENAVNNREDWTDPWTDVSTGSGSDLNDVERYIVDHIVADRVVNVSDVRHEFHLTQVPRRIKDKLGLIDCVHNNKRCLRVGDETRFHPYREAVEKEIMEDQPEEFEVEPTENEDYKPLDEVLAMPGVKVRQPEHGYRPVPAGQVKTNPKAAINWKKNYENHVTPGKDDTIYGMVPEPGYMVIDMDAAKNGGEHGWDTFNREAGPLPETYMVRTPHKGIHLYYHIPDAYQGLVKSASHQKGLNVDVKAEGKGYVIGAGSIINDGDYKLTDDVPVAEATPRMMAWLAAHDYIEGARMKPLVTETSTDARDGDPDMTPVPEGQRNDTLYRWAFGRYHNHPEERERVRMELFERGHASGLKDSELETIWRSVKENA